MTRCLHINRIRPLQSSGHSEQSQSLCFPAQTPSPQMKAEWDSKKWTTEADPHPTLTSNICSSSVAVGQNTPWFRCLVQLTPFTRIPLMRYKISWQNSGHWNCLEDYPPDSLSLYTREWQLGQLESTAVRSKSTEHSPQLSIPSLHPQCHASN